MAMHAITLGLQDDDLLAACLLHDVLEDCPVSREELPCSEAAKQAIELLTFEIREGGDLLLPALYNKAPVRGQP